MAETRKILGQQAPGAATEVDLYEVPQGAQCVASSIVVSDRGGLAPITFRISVTQNAGFNSPPTATTTKDYLFYDVVIAPNTTYTFTLGITLSEYDTVRVYGNQATLSFNMFGVELT